MRLATIAALVASLTLSAAFTVRADESRLPDARDGAGPQDVRALWHGHGSAKRGRITQAIITHGSWRTKRMRCPRDQKCRSGFQIYITNDRDDDYERVIQIYLIQGRLQGTMHTYRSDPDCGSVTDPVCDDRSRSIGEIRVWRPDLRTVKMSFPARKLSRREIRSYGWRLFAAYTRSEPCPGTSSHDPMRDEYTCVDYAPERDYWRHRLD
jgi:hypothetical protein